MKVLLFITSVFLLSGCMIIPRGNGKTQKNKELPDVHIDQKVLWDGTRANILFGDSLPKLSLPKETALFTHMQPYMFIVKDDDSLTKGEYLFYEDTLHDCIREVPYGTGWLGSEEEIIRKASQYNPSTGNIYIFVYQKRDDNEVYCVRRVYQWKNNKMFALEQTDVDKKSMKRLLRHL